MKQSRSKAIEAGEMYYKTGKPCKHGHFSKRFTADGGCYECRLICNRKKQVRIKEIRAKTEQRKAEAI